MHDYQKAILESVFNYLIIISLVDFLAFVRAWSMDTMPVRSILKFILKMDVYITLSAILLIILANITELISIVYN